MQTQAFKAIFHRELEKLHKEIAAYRQEENIWRIAPGISNSAGNLCLHLVGNLNTYIGAELGKTGYIRNRELEFSLKNVPRIELLDKINDATTVVDAALDKLTDTQLNEEYALLVYNQKTSTGFLLTSLVNHLGYHLGQINYHRRLLDIERFHS
jgi:uncharacterized damage-inducible protein DinB